MSDIGLGPGFDVFLQLLALSVLLTALATFLLRRAVIARPARLPAALTLALGLAALAAAWSGQTTLALALAAPAIVFWAWLGQRIGLRAWASDCALALLIGGAICGGAVAYVVY